MTTRTKFSLIEPTIQDLKATLRRKEQKAKPDLDDACYVKILILGSDGVGKSSITFKFLHDFFPEHPNLGLEEQYTKLIKYKKRSIELNLIDTGGLDNYSVLYPQKFSYGVSGYIFVYAVDDASSFEFVQSLRGRLYNMNGRHLPSVLVANKCDTGRARTVKVEEGRNLAKLWGVPYIEVSAKRHTGEIITSIFEVIIKEIIKEERPRQPSKYVSSLTDDKIEKLIGIFRFGNLLNMILGIFYILFGTLNILFLGSADNENKGILLMALIIIGLSLIIFAIFGFLSFKTEEPEQIRIFMVLGGISIVAQIIAFILKLVLCPQLVENDGGDEGQSMGFLYADIIIEIFIVASAAIQVFLMFVANNSKEILRRRREIKYKKLTALARVENSNSLEVRREDHPASITIY